MPDRLRWGILGTGNIARQFCAGVIASARGRLTAVASRQQDSADAFARAHQIPTAVGDYASLLTRDDVDAVYVSLPNALHHRWTIAALRAGKHVLCEKPFAVTAAEAEEMFDVADRAGRVVMEAFMYRCHPQTLAVKQAIADGKIGRVVQVRTSFCYRTTKVAGNVRFDPSLAGGALMDVGCYCLSLSRLLLGEPTDGSATGNVHPTGVDDLCSGWLSFPGAAIASFTCGTGLQANNTASSAAPRGTSRSRSRGSRRRPAGSTCWRTRPRRSRISRPVPRRPRRRGRRLTCRPPATCSASRPTTSPPACRTAARSG